LAFCRYLRSLHPPDVRIAIVLDNFSPHLSTKKDQRVGEWAAANNVELAYTPFYSSWLNRIEAQFKRCATSPSTAPTTTATPSKPR
jgi:transposase